MSSKGVNDANFLRLWTGQTLAQFGRQLGAVALPIVSVQLLHATESQLGWLNAAETAAFLLVGLPAGAWVDRWYKRTTMIVADVVRLLAALAIPLLYLGGQLAIWHLYVVALVLGLATVFFDVSYQSYIPLVVDTDDDIGAANARMETSSQLSVLTGPGLGGLLLKVISAPLLLLADAAGYLASVLFLLTTHDHERAERSSADPAPRLPLLREIGEGLQFVWNAQAIRRVAASTAISNFSSTILFTLAPILELRLLGFDGFTFGLAMAVGSVGGLLGAVLTPRLRTRIRDGILIPGGMLVATSGMALYPLAFYVGPHLGKVACIMVGNFVMSFGVLVYNITQVTLRQRLCPRRLLGRMNASIRFVIWGIMPIGALLAGLLGTHFGTVATSWIACAAAFVAYVPLHGLGRHIPDAAPATP